MGMGSATIFFWLQVPNVTKKYRTALIITGLVTCIATYHYFRIFNSWNDAFDVKFDAKEGDYVVSLTGAPFNDAYRYVDWILTVPLLLIELILVMGLPASETVSKSWTLGVASAVMVALGYPGEIQNSERPVDVVVLCDDSVSLCCGGAGCRIERSSWIPGAVGCFPHRVRSLAHDYLMADLSLRVHHQDA